MRVWMPTMYTYMYNRRTCIQFGVPVWYSVLPVCGLGVVILLVSADTVYVLACMAQCVAGLRTQHGHFY